jgi:hypothetical protein
MAVRNLLVGLSEAEVADYIESCNRDAASGRIGAEDRADYAYEWLCELVNERIG